MTSITPALQMQSPDERSTGLTQVPQRGRMLGLALMLRPHAQLCLTPYSVPVLGSG